MPGVSGIIGFFAHQADIAANLARLKSETRVTKNHFKCDYLHHDIGIVKHTKGYLEQTPIEIFYDRYAVAFCGYISNRDELSTAFGGIRRAPSDSNEWLIQYYLKHGIDGFAGLNGVFLFVIHDRQTSYCQMLCMTLGDVPIFFYSIYKFNSFDYSCQLFRMMKALPSFLSRLAKFKRHNCNSR